MFETPKIIDHVPSNDELVAQRLAEDTMNMRDPAQLAQLNAAREALGYAPASAPGPKADIIVAPQSFEPAATGEPLTDIDRPVSQAELAQLRLQIAAEAGYTAVTHM